MLKQIVVSFTGILTFYEYLTASVRLEVNTIKLAVEFYFHSSNKHLLFYFTSQKSSCAPLQLTQQLFNGKVIAAKGISNGKQGKGKTKKLKRGTTKGHIV